MIAGVLAVVAGLVVTSVLVMFLVREISREMATALERATAAGTRAAFGIPSSGIPVTDPAADQFHDIAARLDGFEGDPAHAEDAPVTAEDIAFHAPWESTTWAEDNM